MMGVIFIGFNVIIGFAFGALKTFTRTHFLKIFNKKTIYDYDKILASNILESMRAINVTKIVENIAYFKWQNIPVVSQDAKLELISHFEVQIDLKAKRSVYSSVGIMFKLWSQNMEFWLRLENSI